MADPIKVKLLDAQKNPILPETSADQVKTTDGSNVETKLKTLESAVSGKVPCHIVNDIAARDGLESPKQGTCAGSRMPRLMRPSAPARPSTSTTAARG